MNELKVASCFEFEKVLRGKSNKLFYPKAEADKVIAELKKEIEEQKRLRDMALASVPNALKVMKIIQHNKYKRCLAMADKCVDLCHKAKNLYRWAEDENLEHHYNHKIEFFARWCKRWLAIAEKFKEG